MVRQAAGHEPDATVAVCSEQRESWRAHSCDTDFMSTNGSPRTFSAITRGVECVHVEISIPALRILCCQGTYLGALAHELGRSALAHELGRSLTLQCFVRGELQSGQCNYNTLYPTSLSHGIALLQHIFAPRYISPFFASRSSFPFSSSSFLLTSSAISKMTTHESCDERAAAQPCAASFKVTYVPQVHRKFSLIAKTRGASKHPTHGRTIAISTWSSGTKVRRCELENSTMRLIAAKHGSRKTCIMKLERTSNIAD